MTKFGESGNWGAIRAAGVLACAVAFLLGCGPSRAAEPLSVDQCIDIALKNNPGLAQAGWQLKGAEASRLGNSRVFLPSVSYSFSAGRTNSRVPRTVKGVIEERNWDVGYQHDLSVRQSLVNLPDWFGYRATGADVGAARETFRGSRADLIYQVRQQYFALLGSILLHENAKEALAVSEDQLKRSQALFDVGSVARSDVLQSRVNRANAVRDEISARNAVEQTQAQLSVLLGGNVQEPIEIRQDVDVPSAGDADEGTLIREAMGTRPEVRQVKEQLRAADFRYRSAWWSHFPTLDFSLGVREPLANGPFNTFGGTFRDAFDLGKPKSKYSYGYAFSLNWSLFDGMATYGSVRGARADLRATAERQRQEELNAALGVREARIAIRNADEGRKAADEAVALAEENLKLQEALYQNGAGTVLELNNAQVERTKAKNSLVEATISLHLANAQLDRALGR